VAPNAKADGKKTRKTQVCKPARTFGFAVELEEFGRTRAGYARKCSNKVQQRKGKEKGKGKWGRTAHAMPEQREMSIPIATQTNGKTATKISASFQGLLSNAVW
jgi:hypothetical protein